MAITKVEVKPSGRHDDIFLVEITDDGEIYRVHWNKNQKPEAAKTAYLALKQRKTDAESAEQTAVQAAKTELAKVFPELTP